MSDCDDPTQNYQLMPNFGAALRTFAIVKRFVKSISCNYKVAALLIEMQKLLFSVGFGEKEQSKISDYLNKILETAEKTCVVLSLWHLSLLLYKILALTEILVNTGESAKLTTLLKWTPG